MKKKIILILFPLILIAVSIIHFEGLKNNYKKELISTKTSYEKKKSDFADKESLKKLRANYFAKIFLLDFSGKFQSALSGFFSNLKSVMRRDVKLSEFEFIPDVGKIDFKLKIEFETGSKDFPVIYRRIENFRNILFVSFEKYKKIYIISGEIEIE